MMKFPAALHFSWAAAVLLGNASEANAVSGSDNQSIDIHVQKQIDWLKSKKGGFFSPKIAYGNLDKSNTSFSGMFALAPIKKGEEIIHLPVEHFITSEMNGKKGSFDPCDTAENLAAERLKGEESDWEPYVTYSYESFPHEHLPANWSEAALKLFKEIIAEDLEPQGMGLRGNYESECLAPGETADEIVKAAYRIALARGWSYILLPLVDMFNHRNGKWYNADQEASAHTGEDISVVALRDVKKGEQIYLSYNECPDLDCEGLQHMYTMPQILADFGFVEQYPRRFAVSPTMDVPTFELDEDAAGEVVLSWLLEEDDKVEEEAIEWFYEQYERLKGMELHIQENLKGLEGHEQDSINAFYNAMIEGLSMASSWFDDTDEDQDEEENKNEDEMENYDDDKDHETDENLTAETYCPLEDHKDDVVYTDALCWDRYSIGDKQAYNEEFQSIYQEIEWKSFKNQKGEKVDTCLYLDNWLHMCNSLRPHYHEWFVHYPAQFLKQMKRVLFLGGGDNMILHEVLKYPDLELVVGMELDQMVVRGSFKHFKTEPHFDDDRVEWWFGDAAKSLKMLPNEYLGTFDLIVVDLLTYVTESLMVTDDLNILESSMLLLNKEGILTMNEDFVAPTKAENSQYSVDLEIMQVPIFCEQSINMFSNNADFLRAAPIDHGVDTLVVKPGASKTDRQKFDSWWNYHRNSKHKVKERKAKTVDAADNSQGIMIVLEAEEVTVPLDSIEGVYAILMETLKAVGLTPLSSSSFAEEALMISLKEGYVMLRSWSEHNYCAFDIVLWSSLIKLEKTKKGLIAAVGAKTTSSYKIVFGGMRGVETIEYPKFPGENDADASMSTDTDAPVPRAFKAGDLDIILKETIELMQDANSMTIVFCPRKGSICLSLEALQKVGPAKIGTVIPIWSCVSGKSMKRDVACEEEVVDLMSTQIPVDKISSFVIDPGTPRKMGHVMKAAFSSSTVDDMFAKEFLFLAPALNASSAWRIAFFEWLRTDVGKMTPAHHAEVLFSSDTRSGKLSLNIFSSGDSEFYPHLVDIVEKCESATGFVSEIPSVRDGKHHFMSPFSPPIVANESSYDKCSANIQWDAQNPLGMQTVIQFDTKVFFSLISAGEEVLGNYDVNALTGRWYPAEVESANKDGTFDLLYDDGEIAEGVGRNSIRKWEKSPNLAVGEAVFVMTALLEEDDGDWYVGRVIENFMKMTGIGTLEEEDDGDWYVGKVIEKLPDKWYKIHVYDGSGTLVEAHEKHLMRRFEKPVKLPPPEVSCNRLKDMLLNAVVSNGFVVEKVNLHNGAGSGCLASALWINGSAVATWDGTHHLDLNLFTVKEDKKLHKKFPNSFLEGTSSFAMSSHNEQPRGSGRVVNFKHEMVKVY